MKGRHTHTYSFNGCLSGTTRVSQYQKGKTNLYFTEARDSEWQWHQPGHMQQVCTSLQTDNHASTPPLTFYRSDSLRAAQPTASKHWRHPLWKVEWKQLTDDMTSERRSEATQSASAECLATASLQAVCLCSLSYQIVFDVLLFTVAVVYNIDMIRTNILNQRHTANIISDVEICFAFRLSLSRAWSAMQPVCMKLEGSSLPERATLMMSVLLWQQQQQLAVLPARLRLYLLPLQSTPDLVSILSRLSPHPQWILKWFYYLDHSRNSLSIDWLED